MSEGTEKTGLSVLEDFHPVVSTWFTNKFGAPSPPQVQGWPVIASGKHSLILAPTGSGKTLAAFLWCIDDLFRALQNSKDTKNSGGVHTLYISPLKALNNDIHVNLQEPLQGIATTAQKMNYEPPLIRTAVRTGDTPANVRQSMVKKPPHILITTPESLYLLLTSEKGRAIFHNLRYIIVDEIHAVCNNKRGVHLSLSLERLMGLCASEPVRIGLSATQRPLERVAAFLGGQQWLPGTNSPAPRAVTIVDCGQRKDLDLQVISPVADFTDLPDASVWPALIEKLYDLIMAHKTTLVFVNMRAQTEKIARQLNELHREKTNDPNGSQIALAHHGSISRDVRYQIEDTLKHGRIPAVIATASLELGIDIGSIDLVVQVETPKTVSSALQRVGRSGHLLKATSKGRIIPLYQADIDDAVAFTRFMLDSDIEETHVPENCLDVLAQQIVAEVAMRDWARLELYRLCTQSYCYRHLSENVFNTVVDMLAGRFADNPMRALQARLAWDRVNDKLISRRGSRLMAVMNGGTIADRAYYGVYLGESGTRLGEVEEEFVFESHVGDVFFLGNNEWRIDAITRDRLLVTPLSASRARPPFWKSEPLYRDFYISIKTGEFRADLLSRTDPEHWLTSACHADADTAQNLMNYLKRQQELTGNIPVHNRIIVEYFRDSVGEPQFVIHAPFGGKVLGAWAVVLGAVLENRYNVQAQFSFDEDGILFRLLDVTEPPPLDKLLSLVPEEAEKILAERLLSTPLFAVRFRHNAARALLLPRSRADMRIPLWLQRLRAADLMQAVRNEPEFPLVIETVRDCLQEVYDMQNLALALRKIQNGEIRVEYVDTPTPSPMASGLLFRLLAEYMYDYDKARTIGFAAEVSNELLAEVLLKETIPAIVTRAVIEKAEARWQHTLPETRAKDIEDLFAIIEQLGPIDTEQLRERSRQDPDEWLDMLQKDKRIINHQGAVSGWIAAGDSAMYAELHTPENALMIIRRLLRAHGPVAASLLQAQTGLTADETENALAKLLADKEIVRGTLVEGEESEFYCDRGNFARLYRQAIVLRREAARPAERPAFQQFLFAWHHINRPEKSVQDLLRQYSGLGLPQRVFERELLRSRIIGEKQSAAGLFDAMNAYIKSGDINVRAGRDSDASRTRLYFTARGDGHILSDKDALLAGIDELDKDARTVLEFLRDNGASHYQDILDGTGLTAMQAETGLWQLALRGLAGCDRYDTFLRLLGMTVKNGEEVIAPDWHEQIRPAWSAGLRRRAGQGSTRSGMREKQQRHEGRWYLTTSFAVHGKEMNDQDRAEKQARLLLQRYGILVKEFYRLEGGLLPWARIFQALRKMEWSGEIRRGYFVLGLSGVQFALPAAVMLLEKIQSGMGYRPSETCLLSTIDPALPFGGAIEWGITDKAGERIAITRAPSNHLLFYYGRPVIYCENYGARLFLCADYNENVDAVLPEALKIWLRLPDMYRPRKKLEIETIDAVPAAQHSLAAVFTAKGYEIDGDKLALWPSGL